MNTTPTTDYAHIPAPADATKVTEWDQIFAVNVLHRFFYGTQRGERVRVGINGYQNPDGNVRERWIQVAGRAVEELDAAAARELARALIAAADELDELTP